MVVTKKYSKTSLTYSPKRNIEWIVLHYTAGTSSKKGSALNTATWFAGGANPDNPASADYIVDDETIVQYNEDIPNYYAWCCGGSRYSKPATTLGATKYGICTNKNSINIEICSNKTNKGSLNADDNDWYFTDAELDKTRELVNYLMRKYNVDKDHVIMHHSVTGKLCPAMWTRNEQALKGYYDFIKSLEGSNTTPSNTTTTSTSTKGKMYYVQVGAFTVRSNAEAMLKDVKKHYPGAFIKEL